MDKVLAGKIDKTLNRPEVTQVLNEFIEVRTQEIYKQLGYEKDELVIRRLQGRLEELSYWKNIKTYSQAVLGMER